MQEKPIFDEKCGTFPLYIEVNLLEPGKLNIPSSKQYFFATNLVCFQYEIPLKICLPVFCTLKLGYGTSVLFKRVNYSRREIKSQSKKSNQSEKNFSKF